MITIITNGKDPRKVFRFVCSRCGCVYTATADECNPIFSYVHGIGVELKCPIPFCDCINRSFETIN